MKQVEPSLEFWPIEAAAVEIGKPHSTVYRWLEQAEGAIRYDKRGPMGRIYISMPDLIEYRDHGQRRRGRPSMRDAITQKKRQAG